MYKLLDWLIRNGRVDDFLRAAEEARPANGVLRQFLARARVGTDAAARPTKRKQDGAADSAHLQMRRMLVLSRDDFLDDFPVHVR